jgi:hypothetical protein
MLRKKVIVLGTSFSSVPIYNELRAAGYFVISCGGNVADIGHSLSDEQIHINYSDAEKLVDYLTDKAINDFFVVPSSNDIAYKTACIVKDAFGIDGGVVWALAEHVHEKDKFKAMLELLAIPTPLVFKDHILNPLDQVDAVIVKPIDSFSGIGISICKTTEDLEDAKVLAKRVSAAGDFIVEQFVEGSLHSCSFFIADGVIKATFFVDEFCYVNQFQVSGSNSPSNILVSIQNLVVDYILKITQHLDYKDGLFHLQFIVHADQPYFIEAMLRCPGDLFPNLIELSEGINYTQYYLMSFIPGIVDTIDTIDPSPGLGSEEVFVWRETLADSNERIFKGFANIHDSNHIVSAYPLCSIGHFMQPAPMDKAGIIFSTVSASDLPKIISSRGAYELY